VPRLDAHLPLRAPAPRLPLAALGLASGLLLAAAPAGAQQVADTTFRARVSAPAYPAGKGPVVMVDEGHFNFHTLGGRFAAFGRLLRDDGYRLVPHAGKLTAASLSPGGVLVIANALAEQNQEDWFLPTPSAFDSGEVAAVQAWVRQGGSLLLIADHMPFPGAAADLAAAFGVLMGNGFAMDEAAQTGELTYHRAGGLLHAHPITNGRNAGERVDSVHVFTGQAFRSADDVDSLIVAGPGTVLLLPEVAWQFSKRTPRLSAVRMLQGAVLRYGRGRVAVFGEAAMFTAQLAGPQRTPMGFNAPRAPQNAQFVLNVMHWLTGALPER
jgi:hypothetical protein